MGREHPGSGVRLAELVAALSLGIDLGFSQPMEHVLRQCVIALRIAEHQDLQPEERGAVYWTSLLVGVGCHTDAHEQAYWFGDDLALKSDKYSLEMQSIRGAISGLRRIGSGRGPVHRFRLGLEFALSGHKDLDAMMSHHAAMARSLAEELGLSTQVLEALGSSYEQWDGKGWPGRLRGEAVPQAARIAQLADFTEVAWRTGGLPAVQQLARQRGGRQFDPALTSLLSDHGEEVLQDLDAVRTWEAVVNAEPTLSHWLTDPELDAALLAIADFVDLKSPYTLGHARAVADLVERAAPTLGLPTGELRRAALVANLGRLGVSNAIWDKAGPLGAGEWERIRLHPYITERMLQQSPRLAALGEVALQQRERLDGSGYPRRLSGAAISMPARLLAAADAYQAMCEPRPYRAALAPEVVAKELRKEVTDGRMDGAAVDAVLTAAGHHVPRRREGPAGLTSREVEVLRLLARGLSNKEIARTLVLAPKTVGNHIEHIYTKISASNRAGASLFAVRNGLIPEDDR